ncbi:MAG: hypothetical protein AB7U25_26075 [Vicinamibacterales bacterium]
MDEVSEPTVTVLCRIAKYKGEPGTGEEPYEIIWSEETIPRSEFYARQAAANGGE